MNDQMDFDDVEDAAVTGENKADRFKRVINPRLKVAVKRLRMIRGMFEGATAYNYEFTEAQRDTIVRGLMAEINEINRLMNKRFEDDTDADILSI
jgi:hypothetical protein